MKELYNMDSPFELESKEKAWGDLSSHAPNNLAGLDKTAGFMHVLIKQESKLLVDDAADALKTLHKESYLEVISKLRDELPNYQVLL